MASDKHINSEIFIFAGNQAKASEEFSKYFTTMSFPQPPYLVIILMTNSKEAVAV